MGERINVLFQRRNWLLITEREFHQILAQFQMGLSDFIIKRTFQFDTACLQKWTLDPNMFDNLTRRNNWMEIPFAFDRKKIFCVFTSDDHGLFAHFGNFQKKKKIHFRVVNQAAIPWLLTDAAAIYSYGRLQSCTKESYMQRAFLWIHFWKVPTNSVFVTFCVNFHAWLSSQFSCSFGV